jgi:hypothetical protein
MRSSLSFASTSAGERPDATAPATAVPPVSFRKSLLDNPIPHLQKGFFPSIIVQIIALIPYVIALKPPFINSDTDFFGGVNITLSVIVINL